MAPQGTLSLFRRMGVRKMRWNWPLGGEGGGEMRQNWPSWGVRGRQGGPQLPELSRGAAGGDRSCEAGRRCGRRHPRPPPPRKRRTHLELPVTPKL